MTDETPWLSEAEQTAWIAFAKVLIQLPGTLDAEMTAAVELTFFEYSLLAVLSERPDRSEQLSVIAAATHSSLSRLSHVIARLEKRGFLTRTRLPGPGRRTAAHLTDAGYAKIVDSAPRHVELVRALVVDRMSSADFRQLGRLAEQLAGPEELS
ncbi:MarR family winged helix-turn-helix transcriptional regulator [Williamsia sp. CHRR-6]|uniref:MarR family winged helix-turn-helix transcriptional regulator n=1 Tax=Williamsia sp. CHRR-6 TaxID=2835871 RepID=UPI001BDA931B|nr:MarR family transcriptional regulator [Williamsia sp. CHRR-6]MBT0567851.1 MarR family transcriptional regulator [Williamsia sp. CHRR-6]